MKLSTYAYKCLVLTYITTILTSVLSVANAQDFKPYYVSADALKKEELKTALHDIISKHSVFNYSDLWIYYEKTDACQEDSTKVYDMYSDADFYFTGTGKAVSGMNKEHVAPQSWWGGGNLYPIYTDLFNVYPSEASANNAKSNYPLGEVTGTVSFSNTRCKIGAASKSGGAGKVFEPCDEYKGDFARIYMYDAVCYQNVIWADKYDWAFTAGGSAYPTFNDWIIPIMIKWNRMDPPSEWEILRNERVYEVQGNRNPFIDYPTLAEYIWGDSIDYNWDLQTAVCHVIDLPYDNDDAGNGGSTDKDDDIIYADSTIVLQETFDDITAGNSTSSQGSSVAWDYEESHTIASATTVYKAGGAVRLGTGSKTGSLTTVPLNAVTGESLRVEIDVKGWTSIEGNLLVELTGFNAPVSLNYSAKMADDFEIVSVDFNNIPTDRPSLTISTSAKRCFIDEIRVIRKVAPTGIELKAQERNTTEPTIYNLAGQVVTKDYKGIVIINGHKYLQK